MQRICGANPFVRVLVVTLTASVCRAESLACPGFETCVSQTTLPNATGVWAGDVNAVTGSILGIAPAKGTQMLQFIYTGEATAQPCPSCGGTGCDVWQLVDLSPYSSLVAAGVVSARASARFNRVAVDAQTDTGFNLLVRSYSGSPSNFPSNFANFLTSETMNLLSDGDPQSWESLSVTSQVPVTATFVAFLMSAVENIHNDTGPTAVEFDGHFADQTSLTLFCAEHSGDMNHDQSVNGLDIQQFAAALVSHSDLLTDTCPGDFDDSGIVDHPDLDEFVQALIQ